MPLATVLGTDMSKSSDRLKRPGYVITSTAEAYVAPLAHSSYEKLKVRSDKASQLLPLSWLALSFDGLLFVWCSVNSPLPKMPTCMYSRWQKQAQYPRLTASESRPVCFPEMKWRVKTSHCSVRFSAWVWN